MKEILYGSNDKEPHTETVAQLAQELYNSGLLIALVENLQVIDFEVRAGGGGRLLAAFGETSTLKGDLAQLRERDVRILYLQGRQCVQGVCMMVAERRRDNMQAPKHQRCKISVSKWERQQRNLWPPRTLAKAETRSKLKQVLITGGPYWLVQRSKEIASHRKRGGASAYSHKHTQEKYQAEGPNSTRDWCGQIHRHQCT